jgi:hypothetical protein
VRFIILNFFKIYSVDVTSDIDYLHIKKSSENFLYNYRGFSAYVLPFEKKSTAIPFN